MFSVFSYLLGFVLGVILAILLYENKTINNISNQLLTDKYAQWFQDKGFNRTYSVPQHKNDNFILESQFLYNNVNMICVIIKQNEIYSKAANETWAQKCKQKIYIKKTKFWNSFCSMIFNTTQNLYQWYMFIYDNTFAVPENARRMVAPLDYNKGHYLGHAVSIMKTKYNVGKAGYILSKGSLMLLASKYNDLKRCERGNWKFEDYNLGRILGTLGVYPVDTRDHFGRTTFHNHKMEELLFPGTLKYSTMSYYARSVYPTNKCCSSYAITFRIGCEYSTFTDACKNHGQTFLFLYHINVKGQYK